MICIVVHVFVVVLSAINAGKEICTLRPWISDVRYTEYWDPGFRITAFAAFKMRNSPGETKRCFTCCEQVAAHYSRSAWPGGAGWIRCNSLRFKCGAAGDAAHVCTLQLYKASGDTVCATHGGPTTAPERRIAGQRMVITLSTRNGPSERSGR